MPTPVTPEYRIHSHRKRNFGALYIALILLSFHWSIVLYINSTFLEQFFSKSTVSMLYTIGAGLTILFFLVAPRLLTRAGNYFLTLTFAVLECIALLGMAYGGTPYLVLPSFLVHATIAPLILFHIDIFMEEMIGANEDGTGGKRGIILTIMSLMGALAALLSGFLIGEHTPNFTLAYTVSALFLIPFMLIIMRYFRTFEDPLYPHLDFISGFTCFWQKRDIRNVFFAHFLLQLFFVGMVIYSPLYLANVIGFNWEQIGQILFIGLMAYVFLEYPIGLIADKWIGEKEMMAFGFLIVGVSTSWFTFLHIPSVPLWMFAMFMTRVGASFVETTTEVYFFKHTEGKDANLVSFFRITRPLSYVLGAFLGSLTLLFLPMELLFIMLGFLMVPGLFFAMALKDTR